MRYTLVALLVIFSSFGASAQKHHLFADAATPLVGGFPGFSATYNYKFAKHFAAGGGIQGYEFHPTLSYGSQFAPAVFGDVRLNIRPGKKNQFFSLLDLGIDFYKAGKYRTIVYNIPRGSGFYSGLGIGYLRRITKRDGGAYASLKLISNWTKLEGRDIITNEQVIKLLQMDGTFVFSLGFKF